MQKMTKRAASAKTATIEEAAALNFEPWVDEKRLSQEDIKQDLQVLAMLMPWACGLMFKNKDEMIAEIASWDDERGDLIFRAFKDTHAFLEAATEIVNAAEARILVAGSALSMQDADAA